MPELQRLWTYMLLKMTTRLVSKSIEKRENNYHAHSPFSCKNVVSRGSSDRSSPLLSTKINYRFPDLTSHFQKRLRLWPRNNLFQPGRPAGPLACQLPAGPVSDALPPQRRSSQCFCSRTALYQPSRNPSLRHAVLR